MALSFPDHIFSILRAQSCWVSPSSFMFAISSPLRDRDEARDGHLDPTTSANDWRKSASGLRWWFCWSSSFFCRSTCEAVAKDTGKNQQPYLLIIIITTYHDLWKLSVLKCPSLQHGVLQPGATSTGGPGRSSSTHSLPPSSSCTCHGQ